MVPVPVTDMKAFKYFSTSPWFSFRRSPHRCRAEGIAGKREIAATERQPPGVADAAACRWSARPLPLHSSPTQVAL
jgi:hypothetical protein